MSGTGGSSGETVVTDSSIISNLVYGALTLRTLAGEGTLVAASDKRLQEDEPRKIFTLMIIRPREAESFWRGGLSSISANEQVVILGITPPSADVMRLNTPPESVESSGSIVYVPIDKHPLGSEQQAWMGGRGIIMTTPRKQSECFYGSIGSEWEDWRRVARFLYAVQMSRDVGSGFDSAMETLPDLEPEEVVMVAKLGLGFAVRTLFSPDDALLGVANNERPPFMRIASDPWFEPIGPKPGLLAPWKRHRSLSGILSNIRVGTMARPMANNLMLRSLPDLTVS